MGESAQAPDKNSTALAAKQYLESCGEWLKTNLKQALIAGLISFAIGWAMNFALMAFVYDGWRMDIFGSEEPLATGEYNVRNGMLMWSLFSSAVFGIGFYWYTVGSTKFFKDLFQFPHAIGDLFKRDGKSVWIHISWGASISLLATYFVSRWVGLAVATVIVAAALSPIGIILITMGTQLWRALMRDFGPAKKIKPTGLVGVMVGIFTVALVLIAGFFIENTSLKIGLGVICAGVAVYLSVQRSKQLVSVLFLCLWFGLSAFLPELAYADDGGFAEAGSDVGTWLQSAGFGGLVGYATYGGLASAGGGVAGAMIGAVNGSIPPPDQGWLRSLDPDQGGDPEDGSNDEGDEALLDDESHTEDLDADLESEPDEDDAGTPEDPSQAEPVEATEGEDELTSPIATQGEEEDAAADGESARDPDMAFDPENAIEVIRAANAGNQEAIDRLNEMKGNKEPAFYEGLAELARDAALGPVGSAIYEEIGGFETLKELAKLDWGEEISDTASALGDAAVEYGSDFVDGISSLGGFLWDKASETVEGGIELLQMDADEAIGMVGQIKDDIVNSAVGQTVAETIDGIAELASMDRSEWLGLADQIYRDGAAMHEDAVDALAEKIIQGQQVIEGMTADEALHHLGRAMGEAERYVDRAKKDFWRQNPDAVRETLATATVAVAGEAVMEVTGAGVAKHGGKLVKMIRGGDDLVDAARAADKLEDATDALPAGAAARRSEQATDATDAATPPGAGQRASDSVDEITQAAPDASAASGARKDRPYQPPDTLEASPDTTPTPATANDMPDAPRGDPDLEDWRGKAPEAPPSKPTPTPPDKPFDPERTQYLGEPDLPPPGNPINDSIDKLNDTDLGDVPPARPRGDTPDAPRSDPDLEDWRGKAPEAPPSTPTPPDKPFDPERTQYLGEPDLPPPGNPINDSIDKLNDTDLGDVPPSRPRGDTPDAPRGDPDLEDWRGKAPEAPPSKPTPTPPDKPFDPERTQYLGEPDLPPPGNPINDSIDKLNDTDLGDVPPSRPRGDTPDAPHGDPDLEDWRGKAPEAPPSKPTPTPPDKPFDPERTQYLGEPDLPPPGNPINDSIDKLNDTDLGDVPPARPRGDTPDAPRSDPDLEDWRGKAPEAPPSKPTPTPPDKPFDPERTQYLGEPDLPPPGNPINDSIDKLNDTDLGDVPPSRPRGDTPDAPNRPGKVDDFDPDGPTREMKRPAESTPVDRDAPTERFDDPDEINPAAGDASKKPIDEPTRAKDKSEPPAKRRYGDDYDGPDIDDIPTSPDGAPGTMEEGWRDRIGRNFDSYDKDPLRDPATGEILPEPKSGVPDNWDPEDSLPPMSEDGHPMLGRDQWNPLDEAYTKIRGAENDLQHVAKAPDPESAAREIHKRYERGLERAEEALRDPAMRERMPPKVLEELEDAVRPQNRRTLDDFRRKAGIADNAPDAPGPSPRSRTPDADDFDPDGPTREMKRLDADDFDPDGPTREMKRPDADDFDPDGPTREMKRPDADNFDPDGPTREMKRPDADDFDPDGETLPGARQSPRTQRFSDPDLPPDRPAVDPPGTRRFSDPDLPPDRPAVDPPRTQRFDDPDMPTDHPTGTSGRAPVDRDAPTLPPSIDQDADKLFGASPQGAKGQGSNVTDGPGGSTIPPPDAPGAPPGRSPPDSPRGDPSDAPAAAPRGDAGDPGPKRPMDADDVRTMPGVSGEDLANQKITARTVTGRDADGLPIPHPHDEVTIDIGDKLSNGSFNDVYYNRQSYFADELAEGQKDTLVRVSKPIPDPPVRHPNTSDNAWERDLREYHAKVESLRGDQVGRDALAEVAAISDDVSAPKVLGRFEVLDETTDAYGNTRRSRRVAEVLENVTDGDKGTRALDVLRDRPMDVEEAIAYDKAVRAFNDQGYILTDTHAGNFTFIDMPDGTKKVGIFDPGGIFPVASKDPEIARRIQKQIQAPDASVMRTPPKWAAQIVAEDVRKELIEHVASPDLGMDLEKFVFNPDIGKRNPRLGELFGADDAEEAYRKMREAKGD